MARTAEMKIRHRQFSVRAVLIASAVAAVAVSWLSYRIRSTRQDLTVFNEIVAAGADLRWVSNGGRLAIPKNNAVATVICPMKPAGNAEASLRLQVDWLAKLAAFFGTDMVTIRVVEVQIDAPMSDAELHQCKRLPSLQTLSLANTKVTDAGFEALADWPSLKRVTVRSGNLFSEAAVHSVVLKRPDLTVDQ